MPQASSELRALMQKWFGDYVDETGAMKLLESHGFELLRGWIWKKPCVSHTVSDVEYYCIKFLVDEWDFGGIAHSFDYIDGGTTYHGKADAPT